MTTATANGNAERKTLNAERETNLFTFRVTRCAFSVLSFLFLGCSPQRFFYMPNRTLYVDPDKVGLKAELVRYPSLNGKILTALFFRTDQKPKGTIVHFHGNFGNVSNHFPFSIFLLKHGYDVLAFDYQGYGASEGRPTPRHLVEDGVASVRYAQTHLREGARGVGVLGQSLGGSVAIVVAAQEPLVKGSVIEAAFSGHARMMRAVLKRHFWTWPLYPVLPLFVNRSYDAIRYVGRISPRPIFFIHGDKDNIVPAEMSQTLYSQAGDPKTLWIVPGADHLEARRISTESYEREVTDFFGRCLSR